MNLGALQAANWPFGSMQLGGRVKMRLLLRRSRDAGDALPRNRSPRKPDGGVGFDIYSIVTGSTLVGSSLRIEDSKASFATGGQTDWQTDPYGNLLLGNAAYAAPSVTSGFPYIPAILGTPTGAPTAHEGYIPIAFDAYTARLWAYSGAWYGVAMTHLSNTFTNVQTFNGGANLPSVSTGTPVASLCLDADGSIIKKTTAGSCV